MTIIKHIQKNQNATFLPSLFLKITIFKHIANFHIQGTCRPVLCLGHNSKNSLSLYIIHQDGVKSAIVYDRLCLCRPTVRWEKGLSASRWKYTQYTFRWTYYTHAISHCFILCPWFSCDFCTINTFRIFIPNQDQDWLSEIYAQLLYGKLEYNDCPARSITGDIQIDIVCG